MKRRARIDANHTAIVETLRGVGATVQSLAAVGRGCPDLLVGWCGHNYLLEIKDGSKPPSKRKLTADEQTWHDDWRGHVVTVKSEDEALAILRIQI